ncbi:MAG: orotate phosphoribosyltransferase [Candidatus Aenigmarchaeota archaeon]|nr:orotate phosphoribosyltransferase [Candidatus Aenigmarchaeota archaeon]
MVLTKEKEEVSEMLLKIKAISANIENPFVFVSGIHSPVYVDCRRIISFPRERKRIIELFEKIARKDIGLENFDIVAGGATAGIPYAAFLASKINKPMIYVRKKPKDYGKKRQTEGILEKNQKVLLVEDLVTDGGSKINFFNGIKNDGGIPSYCLVVFSYGQPVILEKMKEWNVKLFWLTDWDTTLEIARRKGYFSGDEYKEVKEFLKDPVAWDKKWTGEKE